MADNQGQQVTTVSQAVSVLAQGVVVAQKRGAYNLDEAALLSQAMKLIVPPAEPEPTQEVEEEKSE